MQNAAAPPTAEQRASFLTELEDVYLLASQPEAVELRNSDEIQAQIELATINLVARAFATDFINNNRSKAIAILAPELRITEDELSQIMNRNTYSMVVDQSYWDGLPSVANFFKAGGAIKEVPTIASYNDFSLLKEVNPSFISVDMP